MPLGQVGATLDDGICGSCRTLTHKLNNFIFAQIPAEVVILRREALYVPGVRPRKLSKDSDPFAHDFRPAARRAVTAAFCSSVIGARLRRKPLSGWKSSVEIR